MTKTKTMKTATILLTLTLGIAALTGCDAPETTDASVNSTVETEETEETELNSTEEAEEIVNEMQEEITKETEEAIAALPEGIIALDKIMKVKTNCNAKDTPVNGVNKESLTKNEEVRIIGQDEETGWYLLEGGYFVNNSYLTDTETTSTTTTPTTDTKNNTTTTTTDAKNNTTTDTKNNSNKTTGSTGTSTGSTGTGTGNTTGSTGTGTTTGCQHKNVSRWDISGRKEGCTTYTTYQDKCDDCGVNIGKPYEELTCVNHIIVQTNVILQERICGVQDGMYYTHYECACGQTNYDGPTMISGTKDHCLHPYQYYDGYGNLWEGEACSWCPYKSTGSIVQYAPTEE